MEGVEGLLLSNQLPCVGEGSDVLNVVGLVQGAFISMNLCKLIPTN